MPTLPPVTPTDFVRGPLAAPVVVVHYGDFECPYSGAFHATLRDIETRFGDQIAVVFRHFPLADVHPDALTASVAAQAASQVEIEKFWPMHDLLFQNQRDLRESDLMKYAREIGIDGADFRAAFGAPQTLETVQKSLRDGQNLGLHGTPSVWVNGKFYDNDQQLWDAARMLDVLENAGLSTGA